MNSTALRSSKARKPKNGQWRFKALKWALETKSGYRVPESNSIIFIYYIEIYLLIDLDVNLVPLSVAANQRQGFMEILHCDWLPP